MVSSNVGKQFSLDSRIDLVFHGLEAVKSSGGASGADDSDGNAVDVIVEDVPDREGTKGRYCS